MKRYVGEAGSDQVARLLAENDLLATARLTRVEIASALVRQSREGLLELDERNRILASLEKDLEDFFLVELTAEVAGRAEELLIRHRLRAANAIQLASCLVLQSELGSPVRFVGWDDRLSHAAAHEGLDVLPKTS